ncbi:MAG: putative flap endonuclease-1-like 5' DNA nuclease, partial [Paraglaciecola sp.]
QAAQTGLSAAAIMTEAEGEESSEEEMSIKDSKAAITTALGGAIGMASADEKDDLTQINGIGEFIEDKLNDLGIYKFEQISNFDDAMIANLTRAIEFFPGRIERDEWVPQAKELSSGNSVSSSILEDLEEEDEIIEVEGAPTVKKVDVEAAKEIVKSKIGSTIPIATADEKDDLKLISGVGPLIEDKLNDLGLFTYEQISLFDSELENRVTDAIEFFPGRIKRDGWVKQAKELLKQKKADIASVQLKAMIGGKISAATADEKDDLKVISGVGPFIEEKINRLGIYSYKQISEFDEEIIKLVTDAIMFFPGRIVRDGWVAQAAELHTTK